LNVVSLNASLLPLWMCDVWNCCVDLGCTLVLGCWLGWTAGWAGWLILMVAIFQIGSYEAHLYI
jgi:hypothetical protein